MKKDSTSNTVRTDQTDWPRVRAMHDGDIAHDEDRPRTTETDWDGATMRLGGRDIGTLRLRGPQKTPVKVSTTVRFDTEVLEAFRATGRGWQTRMNDALKDWLKTHTAA